MMLRYHWPPLTVRRPTIPDERTSRDTIRRMDLDEAREALRQNGYTIIRSSRIIPCYGQVTMDAWYHGSDPEYIQHVRKDAAKCAAREAAVFAHFTDGPGAVRGASIVRAELAVINTAPGRDI